MNWDDLRIFSAVAAEASLTDAARRLQLSVATVSRRMQVLEHATGLRLVNRSPSGVRLTSHGEALRARAAGAVGAIGEIDRMIAALRAGSWPERIRVSATEPVIAEILAPALPKLLVAAPEIRVDLVAGSEIVSLAASDAELAVRFAKPSGNSLVALKLPPLQFGLFAAESYLNGRNPESIVLSQERLIGYDDSYGPIAERTWSDQAGLAANIVARMSSTRGLVAAVAAGAGIAVLPKRLVRHDSGLIELTAPFLMPERPVWLLTHRDLVRVKPLRLVRRWIAAAFAAP